MAITPNTQIIQKKTLVLGNDVDLMTPEQLISAIQAVEKAVADMAAVKTDSAYIANRIKELQANAVDLAALLDKKTAK